MKKSENYLFPTQSTQKVDGFLVNDGCIYKDGEHGKCVADFYTSVNGVYVFKNDMTEIIDISFYTMCAYGEIHRVGNRFLVGEPDLSLCRVDIYVHSRRRQIYHQHAGREFSGHDEI